MIESIPSLSTKERYELMIRRGLSVERQFHLLGRVLEDDPERLDAHFFASIIGRDLKRRDYESF